MEKQVAPFIWRPKKTVIIKHSGGAISKMALENYIKKFDSLVSCTGGGILLYYD